MPYRTIANTERHLRNDNHNSHYSTRRTPERTHLGRERRAHGVETT